MKRHLHLAGKSVYYLLGAKLLLVAVVMVALSRFMPWLESNPQRVSAWLTQKAGRPVHFDALQAQWTRSGPLLKLKNMTVGPKGNPLRVGDAELLVSQYSGWWPGRRFTELRIRGVEITLERSVAGDWRVHGLPGPTTEDPFTTLERLGELQVINGKLRVLAPSLGVDVYAPHVDVRTQVNGDMLRVGMRAWLEKSKQPIDAVMRFDRKKGDGQVYVGGMSLDLSGQASALKFAGIAITDGRGLGQAWLTVKNRFVTGVQSNVDFSNVRLQSLASHDAPQSMKVDRLKGQTFFNRNADKWSLQIPELSIQSQGETQTLKGLQINNGDSMYVAVDRIHLKLVAAFADLTDRLPPDFHQWLSRAAPEGSLDDIVLRRNASGRVQFDADANHLSVNPVGSAPGIRGVSGRVRGDEAGVRIALSSQSEWTFDWPAGFGVPHQFTPEGTVVLWRDGNGIRFGTSSLSLRGPDASVEARGGLYWQGDGTHPQIDIAAELTAPAQVTKAQGFWVHNTMSKEAIHWLNTALLGGTVERAQIVISGDLDEWPMDKHNGRFEVLADVRDFRMKFHPEWPEVAGNHAVLQFVGNSMHITSDGSISGIKLSKASADIEHLGLPVLVIHGEGSGDAKQFLELIRTSPLQKEFGEHTDPLIVTGPASARVDLTLPLHNDAPFELDGQVDLKGVQTKHQTYTLAFDQVRGTGRFGRGGFKADDLAVMHEGQPGKLSLRVGSGVRNSQNAFEGDLKVNATVRSLIARVPDLNWMAPHVDGRSDWTASVAIPVGNDAQAVTELELRSNLVGTSLNLPAPFNKSASAGLPTTVRIPLPMDGRGDVQVTLGKLASVRARTTGANTGVAVMLGGAAAATPPARGVSINGAVPAMDALAWMAILDGSSGANTAMSIDRLDVQADRILLGDTALPGARLRLTPLRDGNQVDVSGSALQGTLHIGSARNAPIVGRFDRVRVAMPKFTGASPTSGASRTNALVSDPRKLPPLDLEIKSLMLGKTEFNGVRLKTSQVAAGTLIDRFSATAAQTQLEATGSWFGDASQSRTALKLKVDTRNLGKLVSAMGAADQVSKGRGTFSADVAWPSSPMDLQTSKLSGKIAVDMRQGSLVKVEPGVGRVIGLFSVARLPRRLTLDFSDFFAEGFAFDSVNGDIRFESGFAKTDDFSIKGPSADINIRGTANLETQTFDQTIDVYPKAGNMLTVAGAVAGGPIGAAIGAVAGQILKKPLGQMAAKTYRVTGPWSDPHVETIDKNGKRK